MSLTIANQHSQGIFTASHSWRDEIALAAQVSANAILTQFILLPPREELGFNNTQWVQIAFALLVSYRHTVATSSPEKRAALLHILSQIRSRVGTLSTPHVDMTGARDVFFDFTKRIFRIQNWLCNNGKYEASARVGEDLDLFEGLSSTPNLEAPQLEGRHAMRDLGVPFGDFFTPFVDNWQGFQDDFFTSSFGGVED